MIKQAIFLVSLLFTNGLIAQLSNVNIGAHLGAKYYQEEHTFICGEINVNYKRHTLGIGVQKSLKPHYDRSSSIVEEFDIDYGLPLCARYQFKILNKKFSPFLSYIFEYHKTVKTSKFYGDPVLHKITDKTLKNFLGIGLYYAITDYINIESSFNYGFNYPYNHPDLFNRMVEYDEDFRLFSVMLNLNINLTKLITKINHPE